MTALTPFEPPFRSDKVLAHARGQPCTLRIAPNCDGGGETTVPCHIRDRHKGAGLKASDHSIAFGCARCHDFLDVGYAQAGWTAERLAFFERRGLQETWAILIRDEIIGFPHNKPVPRRDRKTPPRKPKDLRAKVSPGKPLQGKSAWPKGQKISGRNDLRRGK